MHRHHITIFMIHGVVEPLNQKSWRPLRHQLSVQNLSKGLHALSKYYHFVSMDQAVAMLTGQVALQPHSLVLTFDDGYRNNFTHALPVLRLHKVPATFFVCTGHVERREPFWYDRLDYAIQHLREEQQVSFAGQSFLFKPGQEELSRKTFAVLRQLIKKQKTHYSETMHQVNLIANSLEDNSGCCLADVFENDHSTAIMSWEDVKLAVDQGVTIGSHTVEHSILDRLDDKSVQEQLIISKESIEQHTGKQCSYFCYPNGNWNNVVVSMLKDSGYVSAVTTDKGPNKVGDELLALHRLSFPEVF